MRRNLGFQLTTISQNRKERMLSRQKGWSLSIRGRCPNPGHTVSSEIAEYGWGIEVLMSDLENCCAHPLIALSEKGETLEVHSWITVLHGQHCYHGGSTSHWLPVTWGSTLISGVLALFISVCHPFLIYFYRTWTKKGNFKMQFNYQYMQTFHRSSQLP